MENKIRSFRQSRGLTLKDLAEALQTTPQSISRLETGHMTLSTEWLQRFAQALQVNPIDLLGGKIRRDIKILGVLGGDGLVRAGSRESVIVDVIAVNPVAIEVEQTIGIYRRGDVLIGDLSRSYDSLAAAGHDCIVSDREGSIMLRRSIRIGHMKRAVGDSYQRNGDDMVLTAIEGESAPTAVLSGHELAWIAPLVMRVSFF